LIYPSFVYSTKPDQNYGGTIYASGAGLIQVNDTTVRDAFVEAGFGTALDKIPLGGDLATHGFGNIAALVLTFTGSTPITIDLTNLVAATGLVVAGAGTFNGSFATWYEMLFINNSNAASKPVAISPGASNPLRTQLGGTSPTVTLQSTGGSGDYLHWSAVSGLAVDSTHKTLTFTPTSGGSLLAWIGGA
jgi:hypothetical protein